MIRVVGECECGASAGVWLNDRPVCDKCGEAEFAALEDLGRGVMIDVVGDRALEVRPVVSRPLYGAGPFGLGTCVECDADAVYAVDDDPVCVEHYALRVPGIRRRLYGAWQ